MIAYLNINSIRNKIDFLREICKKAPFDILCVDETKIDSSFPDAQFHIEGYQYPPFRRDRDENGGGKIVYIKEGIITKRISNLEGKSSETICLEITFSKKKWCVVFAYRPPIKNKETFFSELSFSFNQITNNYDNFIIIGDLNIDTLDKSKDHYSYLSDFCDTFSLSNLIESKTCFKSDSGTSIDVMLTNRPKCFQKTAVIETGLSDYHKMILSFFRTHYVRLPPKKLEYRDYKNFDKDKFLFELDQELLKGEMYKGGNDMSSTFTNVFRSVLDKHAPLKTKTLRGNQAPFMTKTLSKAIMTRSRLRSRYNKWPSRENFLDFKRAKNYCNNLNKKSKKTYFEKMSKQGSIGSKSFWNTVKPFLTNKGFFTSDDITIEDKGKIVTDKAELTEIFNTHYINIVEKSSGISPSVIGNPNNPLEDTKTVKTIIEEYKNHPSIISIGKHMYSNRNTFDFQKPKVEEINKIIKSINPQKATGPDKIPPKIVKLSADIVDSHFTNLIIDDIERDSYSDNGKTASVRPLYKKKDRQKVENYRPVSILNCFSKIYEKYIHEQFKPFLNVFLSQFICAYRENYSSCHVLVRLIENWKESLDKNFVTGAVLMDLSKAFDCIPHDLLIAKLHAYGFSLKAATFIYSYLKRRKQNVKIDDVFSSFQTLLSGVPQGSVLGPILFNIFLNDLLNVLTKSNLYNFADDNTISAKANNIEDLLKILQEESELAVKWFRDNNMIVNPDKFQAIILQKGNKEHENKTLAIENIEISTTKSVELLGLTIDDRLTFEEHISTLCKRASLQLNAISRLQKYMNQKEKEAIINSFIYSNFNYCPLVWHFCSCKSSHKIEQIQKRCLRIILNDNESDYETLLEKSNKETMTVKRMRTIATEIFKTINDLNPKFMKEIFIKKVNPKVRPNNIVVKSHSTATYGDRSLSVLGPKLWNSLPENIKSENSYSKFKEYIKTWFGPTCYCSYCKN